MPLPLVDPADIPVDQLKFIHCLFDLGDVELAVDRSGLQSSMAQSLIKKLDDKTTRVGRYLSQIKRDYGQSISITIDQKRLKLWRMVELCTAEEDGLPKKPMVALKCLDMLNKMDGHYAPVKAQVQTQAQIVRFDQRI